MAQLSYPFDMTEAFEGMLESSVFKLTDGTKVAVGAIPFGRGVQNVASEADQVALPSGGAIYGISHSSQANEQSAAGIIEYKDKESPNILRQGIVYVQVEEAVTAHNSPVFVRHASGGGGSVIGRFRTDADTATATAFTNAVFLSTTTGAGLAKVQINLP